MRIIGLTGGIATGKSTVSRALAEHDITIIDADAIARDVVAPGNPAHRRIVNALGASNVLTSNGEIDRPRLGALVKCIDTSIHRLEMLRQMLWAFLCGKRLVVLDTPLLFEAGIDKWVHAIIVVYWSPESTQKQRIDAQMSIERKKQLATIVIDNSFGIRETRQRVDDLMPDLKPSYISTAIAWSMLSWPAAVLYSFLTIIKVLRL
ncbi:dephospho-CoA kinase-domain-containing protein [Chytridium lagenaria]|nr:dephospho-CoA kinase-domain-containing protein [Chytridium lagenaria]